MVLQERPLTKLMGIPAFLTVIIGSGLILYSNHIQRKVANFEDNKPSVETVVNEEIKALRDQGEVCGFMGYAAAAAGTLGLAVYTSLVLGGQDKPNSDFMNYMSGK
jgi:hypothetical protein